MQPSPIFGKITTLKASQKARARWSRNKKRPAYFKQAGKARWLDTDSKPRIPEGGPKRK